MTEQTDRSYTRPPVEDRWIGGREAPGTIEVRTRFLYSDTRGSAALYPEGRHTHAFARGGKVTASDWPSDYEHMQDLAAHISRAVATFGDDADLVITVARRPVSEVTEEHPNGLGNE